MLSSTDLQQYCNNPRTQSPLTLSYHWQSAIDLCVCSQGITEWAKGLPSKIDTKKELVLIVWSTRRSSFRKRARFEVTLNFISAKRNK